MTKTFTLDVFSDAILVETILVEAESEEEAIEKYKNGYIDDIIDSNIEVIDVRDIEVVE